MKTIKKFNEHMLNGKELVNLKGGGGNYVVISVTTNPNGSITERGYFDENGDGVRNVGEKILSVTYGPILQ